jgi:hypothetical protein
MKALRGAEAGVWNTDDDAEQAGEGGGEEAVHVRKLRLWVVSSSVGTSHAVASDNDKGGSNTAGDVKRRAWPHASTL